MAGGLEQMLVQVIKGLGVDPTEISSLATNLQDSLNTLNAQQKVIIRNQHRIMRHLDVPIIEDEIHDDGNGSSLNGSGN